MHAALKLPFKLWKKRKMDRAAYLTHEVTLPLSLSQPVPSQPADQTMRPQKLTVLIYEVLKRAPRVLI